jgi:hypothetical protein
VLSSSRECCLCGPSAKRVWNCATQADAKVDELYGLRDADHTDFDIEPRGGDIIRVDNHQLRPGRMAHSYLVTPDDLLRGVKASADMVGRDTTGERRACGDKAMDHIASVGKARIRTSRTTARRGL